MEQASDQTPVKSHVEQDLDHAWDDVLLIEDRAANRGLREGITEGIRRGHTEGFALGVKKGAQIGAEVGFYLGFAKSWAHVCREKADVNGSGRQEQKVVKALDKLTAAAEDFPCENIKDEDVLQRLEEMRARFKLCCQVLKIKSEQTIKAGGGGGISW
jgi:flagellar biosynthesis/type III secretory pathway protein FliH